MRGAERQNHQHNDVGRLMEEEEELCNVCFLAAGVSLNWYRPGDLICYI